MTCHDWTNCTVTEARALVDAEIAAWLAELSWDVRESWRVIEPARRAGQLPGFVVRDRHGRPVAWAACTMVARAWHVFALSAAEREAATLLVDAIAVAAGLAGAARIVFSVRDSTPALAPVLASRGYRVERYRYLMKPLADAGGPAPAAGRWIAGTGPMARLCARAYRAAPGVRAFAMEDTPESWDEYVHGLVTTDGCGRFARDLSDVVAREDGELDAAVLVTRLGPGTIHIAQLAVDPVAQGRGIGRALVGAVERRGAAAGAHALTLLVAASNVPAARLYEARGFRDRASFVVATRQPSLSTSLALPMGGASTRR
ncbi:MAG: GNAT family N-acetyltransferase [Acidobacteria bacterium]|nr:GNAT family N-acetyltransferase [Acidobacteriota bacterium]